MRYTAKRRHAFQRFAIVSFSLLAILSLAVVATADQSDDAHTAESPHHPDRLSDPDDEGQGEALTDLMGGFDDDPDFEEFEKATGADDGKQNFPITNSQSSELLKRPWARWIAQQVDLSGSLGVGAVYSYLSHHVPHGDQPGRITSYGNLSRLDLGAFLQLDIDLPARWKIRGEVTGWYDSVYRLKGRDDYGRDVLNTYEWNIETGEVYLTGPLTKNLDVTIGRKVVNWGRSDTFRVVDVINPLDNKEPGLVDIEDLRRPKAMLKFDATYRAWSAQLLVIPENRYDRSPPRGSDFSPDISALPPAFSRPAIRNRSDFSGIPGLAAKIDGRFSGWDLSLYGAFVEESSRILELTGPAAAPTGTQLKSNQFGMVGAAGNLIQGAWLLKLEVAWLKDLQLLRLRRGAVIPTSDDTQRIDSMIGVEYYGPDDLTIALEIVSRQRLNEPKDSSTLPATGRSRYETGLRISRSFLRERLNVTALAVGFGERLQNGGVLRFSGDYDFTDAWNLEAGILLFLGGPENGLGAFDSNDRLYTEVQFSF